MAENCHQDLGAGCKFFHFAQARSSTLHLLMELRAILLPRRTRSASSPVRFLWSSLHWPSPAAPAALGSAAVERSPTISWKSLALWDMVFIVVILLIQLRPGLLPSLCEEVHRSSPLYVVRGQNVKPSLQHGDGQWGVRSTSLLTETRDAQPLHGAAVFQIAFQTAAMTSAPFRTIKLLSCCHQLCDVSAADSTLPQVSWVGDPWRMVDLFGHAAACPSWRGICCEQRRRQRQQQQQSASLSSFSFSQFLNSFGVSEVTLGSLSVRFCDLFVLPCLAVLLPAGASGTPLLRQRSRSSNSSSSGGGSSSSRLKAYLGLSPHGGAFVLLQGTLVQQVPFLSLFLGSLAKKTVPFGPFSGSFLPILTVAPAGTDLYLLLSLCFFKHHIFFPLID